MHKGLAFRAVLVTVSGSGFFPASGTDEASMHVLGARLLLTTPSPVLGLTAIRTRNPFRQQELFAVRAIEAMVYFRLHFDCPPCIHVLHVLAEVTDRPTHNTRNSRRETESRCTVDT